MIIIEKMKTKQHQKQQNTIYNGRNGQINLDDHNNNEDDDYDVKNYDREIMIMTIIMGRIINVNHNNNDRVNTMHNNNIYDGSDNVDKYGNTNNGE